MKGFLYRFLTLHTAGSNVYLLLAFSVDAAGNGDIIYASSGIEVKAFDVHMITCNSKSSFLVGADYGADTKGLHTHTCD
ncbi:hypothetical protein L6452_43793 [Arctium lappa]|uniref:Uncharacterized protein n=1 Tax=Arctium lappa TaxID=4217 RepID=A0ACB8XF19_ARCLA|nr:hypothetical protein L6452_43793 [Arctium lappa]